MFACLCIRHFGGHVKSPLHSEQFAKKVTCLWEYSLLPAINKLTLSKLKLSKVYPHRHFQDPKTERELMFIMRKQ